MIYVVWIDNLEPYKFLETSAGNMCETKSPNISSQGLCRADDVATHPNVHFIIIFDILHIIGPVPLLAILLTAWRSSEVTRTSTQVMSLSSWIIFSVANLVILGQQTGPPPATSICLVQAMLIYSSPVLVLHLTDVSIVVHFLRLDAYLSASLSIMPNSRISRTHMILFYVIPCGVPLAIIIEVLVLGLLNPSTIRRDPSGMYCDVAISIPSKITGGAVMCGLLILLVLEVLAYLRARRECTALLKSEYSTNTRQNFPGDVIARMVVFTFCALIAFSLSFVQYLPQHIAIDNGKVTLVQATLPFCAGLIFGTQMDILRVWIPRKRQGLEGIDPACTYNLDQIRACE
ncbi:hypothetical protein BDZ97DRAFT_1916349 [Flammula alnicola]|nr:hypothetical protein BDZ97DRAFT_1916349 [Flammula alnicola]